MNEMSLNVLQAGSFQLVDERGEIIAVLASSPDKRPNLLIFDKNGKPVVSLGVNASDEPACTLVAGNNNATISLSLNEGQPSLLLTSKDGTPRASLTLITNDEPVVAFYDRDGKAFRALLGTLTTEALSPGKTGPRTHSSLVFFDEQGNVLWKAP